MKTNKKRFVRFLGVNASGMKSKMLTFRKVLKELEPSVFFIQESKYSETGQMKLGNNFIIFELVRQNRSGGGLALGCSKDLKPVLMREGNDEIEALSVNIFANKTKIRCCLAYGPQENENNDKKEAFWNFLDNEVNEAVESKSGFILQFDGNLWAGDRLIPGDPRPQNKNGKLFEEFLNRNPHLVIVNSLPICKGLITRSRLKDGKLEESVLDIFVVCSSLLPYVKRMVIDENKKYILTNYHKAKNGEKAVDTDHFTEFMDLEIETVEEKPAREEIFNFKDLESQELFKNLTSDTKAFTNCFNNEKPIEEQIENWRKTLKNFCHKAFKKIRIKRSRPRPIHKSIGYLIDKRNALVKNKAPSEEINNLDSIIADKQASHNREKILKNFKTFSENPENIQMNKMWKLMKNICPKIKQTPPTAKKNYKGKLISTKEGLKNLLANEYKNRLRTRPVREDYKSMKLRRKKIFEMKMFLAKRRQSEPWTMKNLDTALSDLKNNKSRDFEGYINEIFKKEVIGSNLKESLLIMFNSLKHEKIIPQFFNYANITTVPKSGPRSELKNERGIFCVPVIRAILMRLIYNSKYDIIDKNMSDSQMGARKGKGCKSNIWMVNGIIHETLRGKNKKPVLFQIYDYAQMFDSMHLEEAINDIYDVGLTDENLALIHKANEKVHMSVKTTGGLTRRQIITDSVLQGDTWGSMLASVQADAIAKDVEKAELGYTYKGSMQISMLGLVDDLIGITEVGYKAQQLNAILNVKSAEKGLQFGTKKCKTMLVGHMKENYTNNELKVDYWKEDMIERVGNEVTEVVDRYMGEIVIDATEQYKYLGFVISTKGDNMANITAVQKKSNGIIRSLLNKLEKLNLRDYYYECAIIFMNAILRGSILYASETYYNLTEKNIRILERIEENFMRKILKTKRSCPIIQMYLELGQWPARFEIKKQRLLFLKNILDEDEKCRVFRFFQLQLEHPSKNDWVSNCKDDLKQLEILESFDQIRKMSRSDFKQILKTKIRIHALQYLLGKRGSKGKQICYDKLEMAEYLLPHNKEMNNIEKQNTFSIRNGMVELPDNYGKVETCICGKKEDMKHVYSCNMLSKEEIEIQYENIYNGNIYKQRKVLKRFEENLKKRNFMKLSKVPCDQNIGPLSCYQSSNG